VEIKLEEHSEKASEEKRREKSSEGLPKFIVQNSSTQRSIKEKTEHKEGESKDLPPVESIGKREKKGRFSDLAAKR